MLFLCYIRITMRHIPLSGSGICRTCIHLCSLHVYAFLPSQICLPSGLYILLALISSFFYYEQSYLSIYWTDFHYLLPMEGICVNFLHPVHFSDSSRDVAMATNFVWYRICLLRAKVSQDPLDRFSHYLHRTVGIELQMITTFYFFPYLKGRRHSNQFSGKNGAKLPTPCICRSVNPKWNGISLPQWAR